MSLLSSHKDEQKMSVPMNAVLRTAMGLVATIAFLVGIIIDVTYSQMYLSNFVGTAVGWVLSIGVGSAFETIGTAIMVNHERWASLSNFERVLVRSLWIMGYAFDIITNFAEMLALSAPYLAGKSVLDHVIAYVIIGISSIFLAFCEYIFAISLVFTVSNYKVWSGDFQKWLSEVGKDESKYERNSPTSRLP